MNEFNDPLEAELAALRPHKPSPQLAQRIAERLNTSYPPDQTSIVTGSLWRRNSRTIAGLAIAGGLIAASLLAVVLLPRTNHRVPNVESIGGVPQPLVATAFDETLPSLWSYHTSISRSSETLDALLDKHSATTHELKPQRAGVFVLTRSHAKLDDSLGEL